MRFKPLLISLLLVWPACVSAFLVFEQLQESEKVAAYLQTDGLAALPRTKQTAVMVSDAVRRDFNIEERSWKRLNMKKRPFLREDTAFLLNAREGLCGEGTRVIVNLLIALGFDATRVVLYNRHLVPVHALVSTKIDGEEHFVDSINSPKELNDLLRTRRVSAADLGIVDYHGEIMDLRRAISEARAGQQGRGLLEPFVAYSYEAIPASKLAHAVGWRLRGFNQTRPPLWISQLAEKPNLLVSILVPTMAYSFYFILFLGWRSCATRSSRQPP